MNKTVLVKTLLSLCLLAISAALQAQSNNTLGQYALNPSTTGSYNNAIGYYTFNTINK